MCLAYDFCSKTIVVHRALAFLPAVLYMLWGLGVLLLMIFLLCLLMMVFIFSIQP